MNPEPKRATRVATAPAGLKDWMVHAACKGADPAMFFPGKGGDPNPAKDICARCPVAEQCLSYAIDWATSFGVWGGTTAEERIDLRRLRKRRAQ